MANGAPQRASIGQRKLTLELTVSRQLASAEAAPGSRVDQVDLADPAVLVQLTLTLSILGSSVLAVPYAFSRTGVVLGLLTMLVVRLPAHLRAWPCLCHSQLCTGRTGGLCQYCRQSVAAQSSTEDRT